MTEAEIRDLVAQNLGQIDKSLTLVGAEYRICLRDGQIAIIDILAKDIYNCYTIIEIKKSNKSARTTVQQLFKYAHFLKKKFRLRPDQIRCIALSTDWEELQAPFSEYRHFAEYESFGYKIKIDDEEQVQFDEVSMSFEFGGNDPLEGFTFFEFCEKDSRDEHWHKFRNLLYKVPSQNSLLISVDYNGNDERIIHPFGFAWVCFKVDQQAVEDEIIKVRALQFLEKTSIIPCEEGTSTGDDGDMISKNVDVWDDRWCAEIIRLYHDGPFSRGEVNFQGTHSLNNVLRT